MDLFNPVPLGPEPTSMVLGLLLTALAYLLVAALLGLLQRDGVSTATTPILLVGLCTVLVMVYLSRLAVLGLIWAAPMGYVGLVLAAHAQSQKSRGRSIRLPVILAAFVVGFVMSMGAVMLAGVVDPWGWKSISLRELPGVVLFGLAGLGMVSMGLTYLWLSNIRLLPNPSQY